MLFDKSMLNLFFFYSCLHILVFVCVESNFCVSDIKLTFFVMAIYGIKNFFFLPILVFEYAFVRGIQFCVSNIKLTIFVMALCGIERK